MQKEYAFSDEALTNHYVNLFVDRSAKVSAISDEDILAYVNEDNYSSLGARLRGRSWRGYIPDLLDYQKGAAAFDRHGFARDGSGWVAFNYKPQPSTFWPTNGSTDDVLIRLPERFRTTTDGAFSRDVYMANLGLLETLFQDLEEASIPEIDEAVIGVDVDGDGKLAKTGKVLRRDKYFGRAADETTHRMLYPVGTEFLHSVRYVGIDKDGRTVIPQRMKELRYMRKSRFLSPAQLRSRYTNEQQEKIDENLPRYIDLGERGMDTGFGWTLQAFIEDVNGELRRQTDEEHFFCRGCHATVGGNIDQTWAFPRKVAGARGWGYIDLQKIADVPSVGEERGEFELYFERAGGGDEFRSNLEMMRRWLTDDKKVAIDKVRAPPSIYELITPSRERALQLNKAYRVLVEEQSFLFGRDATVKPPVNVHARIDSATAPTLPEDKRYTHDIRLDWSASR